LGAEDVAQLASLAREHGGSAGPVTLPPGDSIVGVCQVFLFAA
jgi:hypothetical protein